MRRSIVLTAQLPPTARKVATSAVSFILHWSLADWSNFNFPIKGNNNNNNNNNNNSNNNKT